MTNRATVCKEPVDSVVSDSSQGVAWIKLGRSIKHPEEGLKSFKRGQKICF